MTSVLKVELHCHLEGTAGPALIRRLAERNNIILAETLFTPDDRFAWSDFPGFLSTFDDAGQAIRTVRDYRDVTYAYLCECAIEGAIYVEVMSSPDHAAAAGMSYEAHLEGIVQGIDDAERDHGIIGRLIVTCVRHFGPAQAMKVADQVCGSPHPYVVGFGMGGDEHAHAFKDFTSAFNRIHMAGLPCTVHAGEWSGAASVNEALDTLPVERIGHGVRAVEDKHVLERLARESIHLEVCPTSNVMMRIYPGYDAHPFNILRDVGISVSLNSDDPPYFATTIGQEYEIAGSQLGLENLDLLQISENALTAAFVDEATRQQLHKKLDTTT
jgi:adenosine deaminase